MTSQSWVIGSTSFTEGYTYHAGDGSLATMEAANGTKLYYTYDGLKRLQQVTTKTAAGASLFYSKTVYKAGEETNQTTNLVSSYGYFNADDSAPHIALNNIRQRLEIMCGGSLTITSREGGGTTVTVTITAREPYYVQDPSAELSVSILKKQRLANLRGAVFFCYEATVKRYTVVCLYTSPGRRTVLGKCG